MLLSQHECNVHAAFAEANELPEKKLKMEITMNKAKRIRLSLMAAAVLFCTTSAYAGNTVIASGEASEDMAEAVLHLASASGNLSVASLNLSGDVAVTLGKPVANIILHSAEISGDVVAFSAAVLVDGLVTTGQLSADLSRAGIQFSADSATLAADAGRAGISISIHTAEVFLTQAVNIAVASGRLSGEIGELATVLSAAGIDLSADSAKIVADAGKNGIQLSEDAAEKLVAASLEIAAECIENAKITERYALMTLEEANKMLREASITTVKASLEAGRQTYEFTKETAGHLHSLGIDSIKYAGELTNRAARQTSTLIVHTVKGTNDSIVVVINTGSGLIVASLDTLTAAIDETAKSIQK